jgi:hypothetical protein
MSPLRVRMIEDMTLAGLAAGTRQIYIRAVYKLAKHYRRSPERVRVIMLISLCYWKAKTF